jgi:hypothetical protein
VNSLPRRVSRIRRSKTSRSALDRTLPKTSYSLSIRSHRSLSPTENPRS